MPQCKPLEKYISLVTTQIAMLARSRAFAESSVSNILTLRYRRYGRKEITMRTCNGYEYKIIATPHGFYAICDGWYETALEATEEMANMAARIFLSHYAR
jgi:hypothetical protein